MKVDVYKHQQKYENWKNEVSISGEPDLSKKNSHILLQYVFDMELGMNVAKGSRKGGRSYPRLNNIRQRLSQILRMLQERGVQDVLKINEKKLTEFFADMQRGAIKTKNGENYRSAADYANVFKAFWHWHMKVNRKKGNIIADITEDVDTSTQEVKFVCFTKEDLDKLLPYFTLDEQTMMLFLFDSIIRAPTELMSLKTKDIFEKSREVWANVREEISKTIGRTFNLVFSGKAILEYISRNNLKPEDYLFGTLNPPMFNKKLQGVAEKIFGNRVSQGGEYYKNMTLYDFRHSGAIHFRPLVKNVDKLRHRGGWVNLKMINHYTKFINMTGQIEKEDLLIEQDRTKLEEEVDTLKKEKLLSDKRMKMLADRMKELQIAVEKVAMVRMR